MMRSRTLTATTAIAAFAMMLSSGCSSEDGAPGSSPEDAETQETVEPETDDPADQAEPEDEEDADGADDAEPSGEAPAADLFTDSFHDLDVPDPNSGVLNIGGEEIPLDIRTCETRAAENPPRYFSLSSEGELSDGTPLRMIVKRSVGFEDDDWQEEDHVTITVDPDGDDPATSLAVLYIKDSEEDWWEGDGTRPLVRTDGSTTTTEGVAAANPYMLDLGAIDGAFDAAFNCG